jgi:hypothetical protein
LACCSREICHSIPYFGICRGVLLTRQFSPEPSTLYFLVLLGKLGKSSSLWPCSVNIECGHLDTDI